MIKNNFLTFEKLASKGAFKKRIVLDCNNEFKIDFSDDSITGYSLLIDDKYCDIKSVIAFSFTIKASEDLNVQVEFSSKTFTYEKAIQLKKGLNEFQLEVPKKVEDLTGIKLNFDCYSGKNSIYTVTIIESSLARKILRKAAI